MTVVTIVIWRMVTPGNRPSQFSVADIGSPPCVQYSVLPANASEYGAISGEIAST